MKHAPGAAVRLALRHDADMLVISIENDLVAGAAGAGGTGTGLLGLLERANAVGGRLDAGGSGRTWTVRAALPVRSVQSAAPGATDNSDTADIGASP